MEIKFPCGVTGYCYCNDCEDEYFCTDCINMITEAHWNYHKRGLHMSSRGSSLTSGITERNKRMARYRAPRKTDRAWLGSAWLGLPGGGLADD